MNGTNPTVLPSLANTSASSISAVAAPNTSINNNVPLSQSAQQISGSNVLSNSNTSNNNNSSINNSNGPLSLSAILSGAINSVGTNNPAGNGGNMVVGANMISGGTAGQALSSILTGGTSIGGPQMIPGGGLSHSLSAHQIGTATPHHNPMSQHQALQQQLQQHFANVANNCSSSLGKLYSLLSFCLFHISGRNSGVCNGINCNLPGGRNRNVRE